MCERETEIEGVCERRECVRETEIEGVCECVCERDRDRQWRMREESV